MGGLERYQQVYVIRDSSDTLGLGAKSSNCTAGIIVEGLLAKAQPAAARDLS